MVRDSRDPVPVFNVLHIHRHANGVNVPLGRVVWAYVREWIVDGEADQNQYSLDVVVAF